MYREHLYPRICQLIPHACMLACKRLLFSAKIEFAKTFLKVFRQKILYPRKLPIRTHTMARSYMQRRHCSIALFIICILNSYACNNHLYIIRYTETQGSPTSNPWTDRRRNKFKQRIFETVMFVIKPLLASSQD